jgi:hypothetical protein
MKRQFRCHEVALPFLSQFFPFLKKSLQENAKRSKSLVSKAFLSRAEKHTVCLQTPKVTQLPYI